MERSQGVKKTGIFYGWWIVVAAFLSLAVFWGAHYTFGVFFKPLSTEFGWTRAMTSGAVSTWGVVHGLSAILMGYLTDKFGPRRVMVSCGFLSGLGFLLMSQLSHLWQLYVFYGLVIGLGYGASSVIPGSVVTRWFAEKRGLALGIAIAGTGIGEALIPPLAGLSIAAYGWRTSYIIVATVLVILITFAGLLMRRKPEGVSFLSGGRQMPVGGVEGEPKVMGVEEAATLPDLSLKEATLTFSLWALFLSIFLWGVSAQTAMVHIVNYATDIGIAPTAAANIFFLIGIGGIVGRLTMGALADNIGAKLALCISLGILAIAMLSFPSAGTISTLYLVGAIFGFSYGGCVPQYPAIIGQTFGLRSHGALFGFMIFGATTGGAIGPLLGGWIFDVYGSYYLAFLAGAVSTVVGIVFTLLSRKPKTRLAR